MLIWFAAVSVVLVAFIFRSPAIDYRTVVVGAVLPVLEGLLGGPRLLHSMVGAVALLGLAMAVAILANMPILLSISTRIVML